MSSHTYPNPKQDLATNCALTGIVCTAGVICTWLAYKDFKKGWQGIKEVHHQIKMLNEMGIKVYKVSKTEFAFNSLVLKEHYTMTIPSTFSQQQKKKAKKHWNLLLTNDTCANKMLGWPATGSVILITIGIAGIIECIKSLELIPVD